MKRLSILTLVFAMVSCTSKPISNNDAVCGGYGDLRDLNEEEIALFDSLFKDSTSITIKPVKVRTQVVAGWNYEFHCEQLNADSTWSSIQVNVFEPLPGEGKATITSITKGSSPNI